MVSGTGYSGYNDYGGRHHQVEKQPPGAGVGAVGRWGGGVFGAVYMGVFFSYYYAKRIPETQGKYDLSDSSVSGQA